METVIGSFPSRVTFLMDHSVSTYGFAALELMRCGNRRSINSHRHSLIYFDERERETRLSCHDLWGHLSLVSLILARSAAVVKHGMDSFSVQSELGSLRVGKAPIAS